MRRLNLRSDEKADLVTFLKNELTDQRVATESGPLFDRPMLYTESARVPRVISGGTAGSGGFIPQVIAIEPPLAGNPSFTVALASALGGAQATLVIDAADPGTGPMIPGTAVLARETVAVNGSGAGEGWASVSIAIPNDAGLIGSKLFGRWFVADGGSAVGIAVSPLFEITIFDGGLAGPEATLLTSVSAADFMIGPVAPESIVIGFAADLAAFEESAASMPLPTALAWNHGRRERQHGQRPTGPVVLLLAGANQLLDPRRYRARRGYRAGAEKRRCCREWNAASGGGSSRLVHRELEWNGDRLRAGAAHQSRRDAEL